MRAFCSFNNALSSFSLCSHFLHELWSLSFLFLYSLSQSFMLRPCSDWKQHWQHKKLCQLGPFATGTDENMRYPGMCQIVTVLYSNEAGFYIPRKLIHLWNFLHACNQNSKTFYRKAGILLVLEWLSNIVHCVKSWARFNGEPLQLNVCFANTIFNKGQVLVWAHKGHNMLETN